MGMPGLPQFSFRPQPQYDGAWGGIQGGAPVNPYQWTGGQPQMLPQQLPQQLLSAVGNLLNTIVTQLMTRLMPPQAQPSMPLVGNNSSNPLGGAPGASGPQPTVMPDPAASLGGNSGISATGDPAPGGLEGDGGTSIEKLLRQIVTQLMQTLMQIQTPQQQPGAQGGGGPECVPGGGGGMGGVGGGGRSDPWSQMFPTSQSQPQPWNLPQNVPPFSSQPLLANTPDSLNSLFNSISGLTGLDGVSTTPPPGGGTGIKSSYGAGTESYIMTEAQRNARYYEGGVPNDQSFFGNSTNVKSSVVISDVMNSVKDNWGSVDPAVRAKFEGHDVDSFFGANADKVKDLPGWKKAALYEVGKMAFETAGTFDPNHKDPGDQAWGGFSLFNKAQGWKDYGLSVDLRGPEGKAALTSPGYGVIADLNTMPQSVDLQQANNPYGKDQWLDKAHYMFAGVDNNDYNFQKDSFFKNVFDSGSDVAKRLGVSSLFEMVKAA